MDKYHPRHNRHISDHLHPWVYRALIGLAGWFVLSVWVLFDGGEYTGLLLTVVTGLVAVMIAIPLLLWLAWTRAGGQPDDPPSRESFHDWAAGEFQVWGSQINGREAATQVLLPVAAVVIGMTLFGIVMHVALPGLAAAGA